MKRNIKEHNQEHEKVLNDVTEEQKKSIFNRLIVAFVLILIVVPCIILGDYVWLCLIFVVSAISTYEIIKTPQTVEKKFNNAIYFFSYFMMICLIYWIFIKNNISMYISNPDTYQFTLYNGFDSPSISISLFALSVGFLFLMVLFDKNFTVADAFYFVSMLFIISIGYQSILYIRFIPFTEINNLVSLGESDVPDISTPVFKYFQSLGLMIFYALGVCINDAGAFFVGILIGKHKMAPRISPKKTWEGFAGGVVLSIAFSFTFGYLMAYFKYPILQVLDIDHWYNILVLSIILPITANFGDLIFSSIKRYYKIKDFGWILQSHGGILDRVDSLLISAVAMSLFIPLMENTWSIYL